MLSICLLTYLAYKRINSGDLAWRIDLVPTAVEMDGCDPAAKEATDAYRKKIKEMRANPNGPQPKAILLSSPQNPLGLPFSILPKSKLTRLFIRICVLSGVPN